MSEQPTGRNHQNDPKITLQIPSGRVVIEILNQPDTDATPAKPQPSSFLWWAISKLSASLTLAALIASAVASVFIYSATSQYTKYAERQWQVMVDSTKAILTVDTFEADLDQGTIKVKLDNIGKIPSPIMKVTSIVGWEEPKTDQVIACYTQQERAENIRTGVAVADIVTPLNGWTLQDKANLTTKDSSGHHMEEVLFYALKIQYLDGIGTKPAIYQYCVFSQYHITLKALLWISCPNAFVAQIPSAPCKQVSGNY